MSPAMQKRLLGLFGAAVAVLPFAGCFDDPNTTVDKLKDGTATVGSGMAVKVPTAVIDNVSDVLDKALTACKDTTLGRNLPKTTCAGKNLGDGLVCPTKDPQDLTPLSCNHKYNADIDVVVTGIGQLKGSAQHADGPAPPVREGGTAMKRLTGILVVLTAFAAEAQAGARRSYPVAVDLSSGMAWGDMGTARNSADPYQAIGCAVDSRDGLRSATCDAIDATGTRRGICTTSDPDLIAAAASIHSDSFVSFSWDASRNCIWIYVAYSSVYQPKE